MSNRLNEGAGKISVAAARQAVPRMQLTEKNVERWEHKSEYLPEKVSVKDLEYPCDDKSYNVKDFSSWSYFRELRRRQNALCAKEGEGKEAEDKPKVIYNAKSSNLWSEQLLLKIENHKNYIQEPKGEALPKVKETKIHRQRMKAAKLALAKWQNAPAVSEARATIVSRKKGTRAATPTRDHFS